MRSGRRIGIALLVSLALHVVVVAWLAVSSRPSGAPFPPSSEPVEFELVYLPPDPLRRPAEAAEVPAVEEPKRRAAVSNRSAQPPSTPAPQEPPPALAGAQSSAAETTQESPFDRDRAGDPTSTEADTALPAPREGSETATPSGSAGTGEGIADGAGVATTPEGLFPTVPGLGGTRANPYASISKGRTIRNGEGEAPDPVALAEMNAEKARRKVQGFVTDDVAAARARPGVVDGYLVDVRKTLQKHTENPPKFTEGAGFVQELLQAWTPGAEQYGKTGNPYAEGATPEGIADMEAMSPLRQTMRERPGEANAQNPAYALSMRQDAAARLREFASGRFGEGIVALVEIRQARDGGFLGAALVRTSGSRVFDQHVLRTAPLAIAEAPKPEGNVAGMREDGMRTLWAFEGRVLFTHRKKAKDFVKDLELKDVAGMAAMSALSALTQGLVPSNTGYFDETTGEVEYVDVTKPRFACRVKLLRVY